MAINKTASRNILRKITKMVNDSNDQRSRASASIFCEDPISSSTPYAEELEHNIDFLINQVGEITIIRIFVNVIFQVIKIELKIAMRKKPIIPTRKVNMYFNRLVLTKLLKYMLTFLVGMAFSS